MKIDVLIDCQNARVILILNLAVMLYYGQSGSRLRPAYDHPPLLPPLLRSHLSLESSIAIDVVETETALRKEISMDPGLVFQMSLASLVKMFRVDFA